MWPEICDRIRTVTGYPLASPQPRSVGGGSINQAYVLQDSQGSVFVKINRPEREAMFAQEFLGLQALAQVGGIRIPRPLAWGVVSSASFIALEYLPLTTTGDWSEMGRQLATLHQQGRGDRFGWSASNTIGSTPQINDWSGDWPSFFRDCRIGYQLRLGERHGGRFSRGNELLDQLPALLTHQPEPCLVHGDLWSGNAAFSQSGQPVIFDPAVYYGDREVDLAMTELFGGFPNSFYDGYHAAYPLEPDYHRRKVIYNLYHILNHFNIFGGGYERQANGMIDSILSGC
ncbi:fructosamine kinase family protein [Candidatus Synechococcus calcipolaris G9]|uniref:Fructosamine kinase family protein n=1 Tax=Candidatus Synechococcus calcipolaris G9 TaxID=1497997 RepID=A0ABT6F2X7_9SYNE|nr:fructosamine kinase family protein [Candidatus Synechococcus calcipolaris]MDG2992231.1 fructosamine kinase family protein [Candidatus Synechococcus calcipolaris G9]